MPFHLRCLKQRKMNLENSTVILRNQDLVTQDNLQTLSSYTISSSFSSSISFLYHHADRNVLALMDDRLVFMTGWHVNINSVFLN